MENLNRAALADMFRKCLIVPSEKLENLEKLRTPPEAPATGLLCLPFEIRLQIYYYCIPRKRIIEVISTLQYPMVLCGSYSRL